jgi:hypothetical protein
MAVLLGFVSQFVDDIIIVLPLLDTKEKSRSMKEGK